jgi:multicomponent Na+:H+ antiporter subunit D
VSALISALVSTIAAYALIRIVFTVFTVEFLLTNAFAQTVLVAGATVSIVLGSVLAVTQREIKRMLAYSSVSQFGLVVGAIAVANGTALTGAVIHLVGHAVMKGGLFLTSGLVANVTGARTVDDYQGLAQRFPTGSTAFGILALAMVGVPPAVGFVGKWYIALGAVEARSWPLVVVILVSTLLTLAYFARVIERMFFREPVDAPASEETTNAATLVTDGEGSDVESPLVSSGMRATVLLAAVVAVVLGVTAFEYGQLLEPTIERLLS